MEPVPSELLTLDEKTNKPATTRVKDGASGRGLVSQLIQEDSERGKFRAVVEGQVDGNQPFNAAKRKANGGTNLNFMEAEALMDSSGSPYYAIFNGVENYAETRTALEPENPDREQWNRAIAQRFHNVLKRWDDFDYEMQQVSYHMRLHGISAAFWDNDGDWRFRNITTSQLLAPQKSASCVNKRIPYLAVRMSYRVHELYEKIRNEDGAKALGWNIEAVRNRIKFASKGLAGPGGSWRTSPWELWQEQLKNNDLHASFTGSDFIQCAHLFVQELSGKVSHFIVTEEEAVDDQPIPRDGPKEDFLLKKPNHYDSYHQVMTVFFQNTGKGKWHAVRGLAGKAFKHISVSNILKNKIIDVTLAESSILLQSTTTKNKDALQLTQFGPIMVLPPNVELKQGKMSGYIEGPMMADRMLTNHLANNVGMFNQRTLSREDGRGEVPTATQINAQVDKESTLGQGQMTLFFLTLDKVYTETFRRLVLSSDDEAKRFRKECEEDGVPTQALKDMEYIRANRSSGYGSPQQRQRTDEQMMPYIPMLPEDGRQNFLEDAVGAIKGADKVRRYVPREHIPNQDDSIAALENQMIAGGRLPVVAAGQNHVIHLNSHFEDAKTVLEPVEAMMEAGENDPEALQQAFQYVQLMSEHGEVHLGQLRADGTRKDLAQMFADELSGLVSFSGKLRGAVIAARRAAVLAAEQERSATAMNALEEAQVNKVVTDTKLSALKTQSGIANSRAKTMNALRLSQIKTAEKIRQDRAKERAQQFAKAA